LPLPLRLRRSRSLRSLSGSVEPTPVLYLDSVVRDDPRHRDHVVSAHDEWPSFTLGSRDLGVDEHVLDLFRSAGEPVAGPPASYLKPCQLVANAPRSPLHFALEIDRAVLEPDLVVFATGLQPAAEVDPHRAGACGEQLRD